MADDGRTFFATKDSLVPRDNNGAITDVYEYAGGRPQLISSGLRLARLHRRRRTLHPPPGTRRPPGSRRSAQTAPTSTSRPSTRSSTGPQRGVRQVLRRPHQRRLRAAEPRRCPAPPRTSATAPTAHRRPPPIIGPASDLGTPGNLSSRATRAARRGKARRRARRRRSTSAGGAEQWLTRR